MPWSRANRLRAWMRLSGWEVRRYPAHPRDGRDWDVFRAAADNQCLDANQHRRRDVWSAGGRY
jgi:hypothetical protein